MEQKPTPGRIVLIRLPTGAQKPLIITDVHSDVCVSGVLFNAFDPFGGPATVRTSALRGDGVGEWNWPARS